MNKEIIKKLMAEALEIEEKKNNFILDTEKIYSERLKDLQEYKNILEAENNNLNVLYRNKLHINLNKYKQHKDLKIVENYILGTYKINMESLKVTNEAIRAQKLQIH